ncbi:hypothetical protein CBR_g8234 [Chara braunii]|uniref:Uncharacterized protein n=1 Tax=Chara braunii TaxID=69332 RepID=A0A388KLV3_CHABU|nr:hypothetical protein CBR_g8234 [Chara braunii]|eukprot:GBG70933.1 hypothetical protein CBR_g8234 [Chara braunii]
MDGWQAVCRSAGGEGGGQRAGQSPSRGSRAVERSEYAHLPPHLQPLPDTSDEEEDHRHSRAVPLGSGSTKEWKATELCGGHEPSCRQSYTQLLRQGLSGDKGDAGVNLTFGLCSGRSSSLTRTVLVDNHLDDDGGQVTAVARPSKSPSSTVRVASGTNRDPRTQQYRAPSTSRGASARPSWMLSPSPLSDNSSAARNRGGGAGSTIEGSRKEAEEGGRGEGGRTVREEVGQFDAAIQEGAPLPRLVRKQDFFQFTGKERLSKGFSFNMDRAVYDEILGSTAKSHTINPKNVADTGASGGMRLPSASSADPESVGDRDAAVGLDDDDDGSTKGSSQTTGGPAGFGKRKSTRQQTFDALSECMDKHGALVASTMESNNNWQCSIQIRQCEALEAEVEVQKKHYAASDEEARLYLVAVARGVQPPAIRRSIVLPHTTIPQHKIDDKSEFSVAQDRALNVQTIALRVIHGWVFKSASRQRGYHVAYMYTLNHAATDIARAIWMGEDWRVCVSPMVFHTTLDMDMKLPLWFVGAYIEDRHEDDELAVYQEASDQRLVGAFTSAVSTTEGVDDGRVSHERLKRVAEAMRVMLAATMWLMRMGGDDRRAHYDAWVFVQLTAKPTLITSMHRSFDARRHIVQAATASTDKLAKPLIALLAPPVYIPDWASIGVKFSHDATLSSPMEAQKLDWLGKGPPEDGDDAAVNDDMSEGGS